MSVSWTRLPFRFDTPADYDQRLSAWIGDAFYDRLPAGGYQVREEQVYLSFRIAAALRAKRPILAEGGSGTGKTFAYLLPLICHARLRGRPAVVATATPALQEQLAGPQGDIATLSGLLGLQVDARVAVRPEDAVCDIRAERLRASSRRLPGKAALLRWWEGTTFGARAEFPAASDALWAAVAWNPACRCDVCPRRGYCRMMKGRAQLRSAADLVVCDHDLFFNDMRARAQGLSPGRLPVLPAFSAVVFDEGHRVAAAAQKAHGSRLIPSVVARTLEACHGQDVRQRLLLVAEVAGRANEAFSTALAEATVPAPGEERWVVRRTPELLQTGARLQQLLARLQDEMTVEEGLHEETAYAVRLAGSHAALDAAGEVLRRLPDETGAILWLEGGALWAVPRHLSRVWRHVPDVPLVFSSATLSVAGGFTFIERILDLPAPLTVRVGVPFRLARQVVCLVAGEGPLPGDPGFWEVMAGRLARVLRATGGRALVLLPRAAEVSELRAHWTWPGRTLWEGDAAPELLVQRFRRDVGAVLVGDSLWEGVDVPGEALSAVVVPLLPLPEADPRISALREDAAADGLDPKAAVDIPEMCIRLKQGVGRLIRAETDRGVVAVLDPRVGMPELAAAVDGLLPEGARRVRTLSPVERFLQRGASETGDRDAEVVQGAAGSGEGAGRRGG